MMHHEEDTYKLWNKNAQMKRTFHNDDPRKLRGYLFKKFLFRQKVFSPRMISMVFF